MVLLENHRGLPTVVPQRRPTGKDRLVVAAEHLATRRPHQAVERSQQGGLARPGGTEQRYEQAAFKREAGAIQGADAVRIDDGNMFQPEYKFLHFA